MQLLELVVYIDVKEVMDATMAFGLKPKKVVACYRSFLQLDELLALLYCQYRLILASETEATSIYDSLDQ